MATQFRLAELLAEAKISQRELVRLAKVSGPTINRMCRNLNTGVSLETLDRISTVLGCDPCDLIVRESTTPKRMR
jgi:DNA-binding Xre family transcriptional regulator